LVTSHDVGLAVPDWPNTFGYNMFLFPISKWVGGVFFEHTHRLWGAAVGFLTILLMLALLYWDERSWMKKLGYLALGAVILQGFLGGLRVTLLKDQIGIFHACLAQTFFVLIGLIALFTSRWWFEDQTSAEKVDQRWPWLVLVICGLVYLQLIFGATMRHAHRGLAISDFPLAYGRIWPRIDRQTLSEINEARYVAGELDTTATQIRLQLAHRIVALLILISVVFCAFSSFVHRDVSLLKRGALIWLALVVIQIVLGATTIWSKKAADIATAHVAFGALILLIGAFLAAMGFKIRRSDKEKTMDRPALKSGLSSSV
jgi:cytochrome c oxidase assembly protein subunit 15